jgi:RHS repeat-associated protein
MFSFAPVNTESGSQVASGPDGKLWVTDPTRGFIYRVNTDGTFNSVNITSPGGTPSAITAGPNGTLWFGDSGSGVGPVIGRITTGTTATVGPFVPIPTGYTAPVAMTMGPDGNIWFTNSDSFGNAAIGVVVLGSLPPFAATCNTCKSSCPNNGGGLVRDASGTVGNVANPNSQGPVRYADGTVVIASTDLSSGGFGVPWGQTRSWTNGPGYADDSINGNGWVDTQLLSLQDVYGDRSVLAVITNGTTARYFDQQIDGTYRPRDFDLSTLSYNAMAGEYLLTDSTGDQIRFYSFAPTIMAHPQTAVFKSFSDPAGNVTLVTLAPDGKVAEARRNPNGPVIESWVYTYSAGSDPNAGLLSTVTLRRSTDGGTTFSTVRKVFYTYFDGTLNVGNLGDLMTATIFDAANNVLDTSYYRYWRPGQTNGYMHGLKYVFTAESYARLIASLPPGTDPNTVDDSRVQAYADNYFEYDASHRVTKEVAQGAGCSACSGGLGTFLFTYTPSGNAPGWNSWAIKTVETLPDQNENIVYTNPYGEVMLMVYHDTTTNQKWDTFYEYDAQGRVILTATPSAVSRYDDTLPDLLGYQPPNSTYMYLNNDTGLIGTTTYYVDNTATDMVAGHVAGYVESVQIRQGQRGPSVPQESWQYYRHPLTGGGIVAPVGAHSVYKDTLGQMPETTSYSYTWYTGTAQYQSMTVTHPVISAGQNGSGSADTETTFFDVYGRPVWNQDGDGFLTYIAYDIATGAVVKTVQDVDSTHSSDFTGLPTGWMTPARGGLHLVTQYTIDPLGRDTSMTDPNRNITYMVYNDRQHQENIYPGWNATTQMPTAPTQIYREDRPGSYVEELTISAMPHLTGGLPDGSEQITNIQTLSRSYTNAAGQIVSQDVYFNLSGVNYSYAPNLGVEGTNYYRTRIDYDVRGRENRVQDPTGTIARTVYDGLDRVVSQWVGINDTPMVGPWSPTNPAGMTQTMADQYDGGGVGDGDLTKSTQYPSGLPMGQGDPPDARVTQYYYDWRDRLVATKQGVQMTEDANTHRPIIFTTYDNLNEPTEVDQYDGDGVTITSSGGVPQPPASMLHLLRAQVMNMYDDRGRLYVTQTFDINPATGMRVTDTPLATNYYYDPRGHLIATAMPGGEWDKTSFDGAGRAVFSYVTDGHSGTGYTAASGVAGDDVLEHTKTLYDGDSNAIATITKERFDNETATGALGTPNTAPEARVYYTAAYFDQVNRMTASANYGTNGGDSSWSRRNTVPTPSSTILVTSETYNPAGWVDTTMDPRGIQTNDYYDNLGRTTKTVQAYDPLHTANDLNKTTEYTYDGSNHVLTVQADFADGTYQRTQYMYGVDPAHGSQVSSNDLLLAVLHPNLTSGAPNPSDEEKYTYNALGQVLTYSDRIVMPNGIPSPTIHTFTYDVLGRQTADTVTMLGYHVDGSVQRIETAYDTQGNPYLITSYNAPSGGNVVNQVKRQYNGLRQLTTEYQAAAGAVDPATSPKVQYVYNELANGTNNSRLVNVTYPGTGTTAKTVTYNYAPGLDDGISRVTSLSDNAGVTLEKYHYLGLDTVVERERPEDGVNLTYIGPVGDAGDQYHGLDRFGRVSDQFWVSAGGTPRDHFQYNYDPNSNLVGRTNVLYSALTEQYQYDNLNQLSTFMQGSHSQSWSLDVLGNWSSMTSDGAMQSRTHNAQNEIATVSGVGTITYDGNGSPTAVDSTATLTDDAWNRLVSVTLAGMGTATYSYDGLGRRVTEAENGTTTNLLYSAQWQVLEEQVAGQTTAQYVWSPVYVDALVLRDRFAGGVRTDRFYVQQDANWNVTSLVSTSGVVVERYVYDPFGKVTVRDPVTWVVLPGGSAYAWQYLFQGGRQDGLTGLYNFRNRDYSPVLGRWLEQDPLGFNAGDTNLYREEGNNPATNTDPSGEILPAIPAAYYVGAAIIAIGCLIFCPGPVKPYVSGVLRMAAGAALLKLSVACPVLGPFALDQLWTGAKEFGTGRFHEPAFHGTQRRFEIWLGRDPQAARRDADLTEFGIGLYAWWKAAVPSAPPAAPARAAPSTADLHPTFRPGPFARESIPAQSTAQTFTAAERARINQIGSQSGCHTCGTTNPGTRSGNFVPDHQPPTALNASGQPQQLYPQCINCSREQGLGIARFLRGEQP